MLNKDYIQELVGLEDVIVKDVKNINGNLHLFIQMEHRIHNCPCCSTKTSKVHDYRIQEVKDISAFGNFTILHLRKRRHVCPKCGKKFFEIINFLPKYHRITNRLFAYMLKQFTEVRSTKAIAKSNNVSTNTAVRIFDKVTYPKPNLPEVLSIDEFKGNANGEKFQCILTDAKHKKVLDVLPARKLDELCKYFGSFDNRKKVKYVIMDMSPLFKSVAKVCFPKAIIVADKYHVVRQVTWAFESVRKSEQKKFAKDRRLHFKRSRQILLKPSYTLTTEETEKVEVMLSASERLRQAYLIKTEFEKFMRCNSSSEARKELSKWIVFTQNYNLPEFNSCCRTYINWSKEILAFFDVPYTNGYTEGINNKIKVLKRTCYGVTNFERFRNRIMHCMTF